MADRGRLIGKCVVVFSDFHSDYINTRVRVSVSLLIVERHETTQPFVMSGRCQQEKVQNASVGEERQMRQNGGLCAREQAVAETSHCICQAVLRLLGRGTSLLSLLSGLMEFNLSI